MGTQLGDIIESEVISLTDLNNKSIAIDAFNTLYQFLAIIRQPDGTPLKDRSGRLTSHLSGLFYRNTNLIEHGIRLVYVFDGEPHELKSKEIERRRKKREDARAKWELALEEGRIEDARRAAQASSKLTDEIIQESKELLTAMGIPVIQAPSEGEALAAQMAKEGIVWASASQDFDSLLYDCPRMVRNLSITGRRRVARSRSYKTIHPELIELTTNLKRLGLTREQLVDIAILIGTDYNARIKGIGPKTALKLMKQYGSIEKIVVEKGIVLDFPYNEIRKIFLEPPTIEIDPIKWPEPQPDTIFDILCTQHDFGEERVNRATQRLLDAFDKSMYQSSLSEFF